ncbi:hypothetical protein [Lunatimonas salinarum]|uniref:hypothetical protein n=1 Tax=Lunatimonas salinarum TaxID=1774590 RepID=UPI001AE0D059|nr:hypothetical protein [Lunatimonas salinarum]
MKSAYLLFFIGILAFSCGKDPALDFSSEPEDPMVDSRFVRSAAEVLGEGKKRLYQLERSLY